MLTKYPFGSLIRFSVKFTTLTGALVDPTEVILSVQIFPDAVVDLTLSNGDVIRDSAGMYHCDYLPLAAGNGCYAWEGTGQAEASTQNVPIQITANLFSPD